MKALKLLPLIIAGPTASGKSKLAMEMAEKHHGVIINADSMQVYEDLPILTAHPTTQDQSRVPHRLYGCLKGSDICSAARWRKLALEIAAECTKNGLRPIFVGGTGLYLLRLTQGIAFVPDIDPEIRNKTRALLDDLGIEGFYKKTIALDPHILGRLKPNDQQRLVRAHEVKLATGKSLFEWQQEPPLEPGLACEMLIVDRPREILHKRAEQRFDQMLDLGALEEVRSLLDKNYNPKVPIMHALGVQELVNYLSGQQSLDKARELAVIATRQYIKRQSTFFRHQFPDAQTITLPED